VVIGNLGQMVAASWQKATISASTKDSSMTADGYRTFMSLAEREC
jgi:hypothetical protein